jgi:glycosyltransferase involved in cell wall biosynthesis
MKRECIGAEMMLSLLFIDTERVWRGGQAQLLTLIKGLHQRGHQIQLICQPQTLLKSRADELGIPTYPMSIRNDLGVISLFQLIIALRKLRPEILVFNTPRPVFIGTAASRFSSVQARIVFRRVNFALRKNLLTRFKYTWGIDCIVAISESIRLQLEVSGIPSSKIKTIYEGMDLSLYPENINREAPEAGKPMTVGTVAHLSPEKGIHYLIEAASLIPNVHRKLRFIVVGEGSCLPEIKALTKKKGLENVFHFAGFHSDTSRFMKTFDIFALPSLSEGLSSAILEAMATSLPIVATEVGGIPELVTNGDNGFLVSPADPESLSLAIQRLTDNPEEARRMGMRGRRRMEEQFTLERKIAETEQLCRILMKRPAPSTGLNNV